MFVLWVMKMVYYKIVPHLIVYRVLISWRMRSVSLLLGLVVLEVGQ